MSSPKNSPKEAASTEALQPGPANALYAYASAFADELARAGAHQVVVCPGSRSTPLALAFAGRPNLRLWMHIDARSAAFFALGLATRLGEPVALLCTSGTAAANFYPALIEAKLTHVPLLALTADRPHELREVGAPQAIDQNRLYGAHVKWFVEVAPPEASNDALRYIRTLADRAVALAQAGSAGPVHLNFPFHEPLTPESGPLPPIETRDPIAWNGRANGEPFTRVSDAPLALPDPATLTGLAEACQQTPHGLIVVGPLARHEAQALAKPLWALAARLGYPILADPLSQLRSAFVPTTDDADQPTLVTSYDAFLRSERFVAATEPQLVLRFGAMPVSKALLLYLQRHPQCRQIVVDGAGDWNEPTHLATEIIHADPTALCRALAEQTPSSIGGERNNWQARWQRVDAATQRALQDAMRAFDRPFEGRIFSELAALLPENATLYVGNSMPVRDLDTFFWISEYPVSIMGNRGASGIDGVVSSAFGAS